MKQSQIIQLLFLKVNLKQKLLLSPIILSVLATKDSNILLLNVQTKGLWLYMITEKSRMLVQVMMKCQHWRIVLMKNYKNLCMGNYLSQGEPSIYILRVKEMRSNVSIFFTQDAT